MSKQLTIDFTYGISREQACILCHLSSECGNCCVKCKAENKNGTCYGQTCSQEYRHHEGQRFETWMYLVSTFEHLSHLRKFVPKK